MTSTAPILELQSVILTVAEPLPFLWKRPTSDSNLLRMFRVSC